MKLPKCTDEQAIAIASRKVSVALSAGAGCGKTFVLTQRFLSHLDPAPEVGAADELHELIAITFTERAAREMRDRIRENCLQRLQSAPAEQADAWLKLLRQIDTSRVSTIHAFCGGLLRSHAVEARLDPRFVILEQSQSDTLRSELLDDVLREKLADGDTVLKELAIQFGFERVRDMLLGLLAAGRAIDFAAWESRTPAEVVAVWDEYRREVVVPWAVAWIGKCPSACDLRRVILTIQSISPSAAELRARCDEILRLLDALATSSNPASDLELLHEQARITGIPKKCWPDDDLKEQFKVAAEGLRDKIKKKSDVFQFDTSAALPAAELGLQLLALARDVHAAYEQRKLQLAALDFDDLLIRARDLLIDPANKTLRQRLAAQTRLLLVDEFQDTDPVQVELIKALCDGDYRGGKLFFVGDYKQSIYRFRGADPGVFRRLQDEIPAAGRLPLALNFRSQPAILEFVNALFCDVLGGPTGGDYQPLRASRGQVTGTPAVEFLWTVVDDLKPNAAGSKDEARRREAAAIARRIRNMLDGGEQLATSKDINSQWQPRSVRLGDIAILFRALSSVQVYEEALQEYGIDYYLVGGHAFYAQQEIYDVVNLLRAISSPADTISLASVLRSPLFALEDESLFWLAQQPGGIGRSLFEKKLPVQLKGEQLGRTQFAAKTLQYLRQQKNRLSIASLIQQAIARTGYDATLLAEFLGERKLANLHKLIEQARTFDEGGLLTLADFITQLSQFVAQQPREPLAATHPEGTDVVRLMTIHQSKGLEFPVVFVPDLMRSTHGAEGGAVYSSRLGPLVRPSAGRDEEKCVTGLDFHNAISGAEEAEELSRLFYVATTRAADHLVLSSAVFNFNKPTGPWMELLATRFDLETGNCTAALPAGFTMPQVLAHTKPLPCATKPQGTHGRRNLEKALTAAKMPVDKTPVGKASAAKKMSGPANDTQRFILPVLVNEQSRQRYSVSRLDGQWQSQPALPAVALHDDDTTSAEQRASASDFGQLLHRVLWRVPFGSKCDVLALVARFADDHGVTDAKEIKTAAEMVETFLASSRAKALVAARHIHRELEFLLPWPPGEHASPPSGNTVTHLQGFIDCLFQDAAGAWHVLDYKTTRVTAADTPAVAAQYEFQLGVYALAAEQILGEPITDLTVYFLRPHVEVCFAWNAARRKNIEAEVNRRLAAAVIRTE